MRRDEDLTCEILGRVGNGLGKGLTALEGHHDLYVLLAACHGGGRGARGREEKLGQASADPFTRDWTAISDCAECEVCVS